MIVEETNFNLIAHHRSKDIAYVTHYQQLMNWGNQLVRKKVPPDKITLIGFSRGGEITAHAANNLKINVNVILLRTCWDGGITSDRLITLTGNFFQFMKP